MIKKIFMDFVVGFFENLCYTIISLFFVFFIKKWYFNHINKHLLNFNNKYHFDSKVYSNYNPFKRCVVCLVENKCVDKNYHIIDGNVDIVKFDDDLRLRIKNKKGNIKIVSISKHLIPIRVYWDIYHRIVKNYFLCKFEKKSKPVFQ